MVTNLTKILCAIILIGASSNANAFFSEEEKYYLIQNCAEGSGDILPDDVYKEKIKICTCVAKNIEKKEVPYEKITADVIKTAYNDCK
jgi:predicted nucleic acid-binding protein